ncbi:serine/threonine protein kinase [Thiolapillus brandeum]|uniref:Stress response kinase A n=1 Tax=Thiolapillus brandeum TaxID=1076588 RepID=A0A7U6GKT4_9GAMM|nr:serine/threonine protein kinase [Thiolapillus brandeum]BAO45480.1 serine/threonine protein kinase [Thiolapillus brandeum]
MNHPYERLSPERILDAVESRGFEVNGSLLPLNSYENRVLQVGLEDAPPLIAKFYRPRRWTDEAILEDHHFSLELADQEIPVVPPLVDTDGQSLFEYQGFRFALYARQGGRCPNLENPDDLQWIGRFIGRIHAVGAARPFAHRETLTPQTLGWSALEFLENSDFLTPDVRHSYLALCRELLTHIDGWFRKQDYRPLRLHGDCHPGNILWTDQGPHFVDMDDCRNGPAIQDLWMLLSGDRREMTLQLGELLEGYRLFHDFDTRELALMEPLRTLRLIHYSAWLARRWDDPAFPRAFTWFGDSAYWQEQLAILEQQKRTLEAPPLLLY